MTEQKKSDEVTLSCSVLTSQPCKHTVKWLCNISNVDKPEEVKTLYPCQAFLKFLTSRYDYSSRFNLKCEVTDGNKVQQFPFSLQPSGEKPGGNMLSCLKSLQTDVNNYLKYLFISWI